MTLQTDLEAAVARVTADSAILHAIVHGPASGSESNVTTEGGSVKTIYRVIGDADLALQNAIGSMADAVNSTSVDAAAATFAAQSARQSAEGADRSAAEAYASADLVRGVFTDLGAVRDAADSVRLNAASAADAAGAAHQSQVSAEGSAAQAKADAAGLEDAAKDAADSANVARVSAEFAAASSSIAQNAADATSQAMARTGNYATQAEQAASVAVARAAQAGAAQAAAAQSQIVAQENSVQAVAAAVSARTDAATASSSADQALAARTRVRMDADAVRAYTASYFAASLERLAEKAASAERQRLKHMAAVLTPVMSEIDRVLATSDQAAANAAGTARTVQSLFASSLEGLVLRVLVAQRDRLLRSRDEMLELTGMIENPAPADVAADISEFAAALDAAMTDPAA